jgi:protein-L-isoaspartate(D-aspartate) O-methyltransferase
MNKIGISGSILLLVLTAITVHSIKERTETMDNDNFVLERAQMVENQLKARNIRDQKVLKAMQNTPRHSFVPEGIKKYAYEDRALGIGYNQTISQPYIVAFMTEAAGIQPEHKVLEIGTGSGYQAAILSQLCKEVYTVEVVQALKESAEKQLYKLGYTNVHCRIGDGNKGWPEQAPFDIIIVTAAPEKLPEKLVEQLRENGKLIIPVGDMLLGQELVRITRTKEGIMKENLLPVRFVPMVEKE